MMSACRHRPFTPLEPVYSVSEPDLDVEPLMVVRGCTSADHGGEEREPRWIELTGGLDGYTAGEIEPVLGSLVDVGGDVVIDLTGVTVIDSAGFRLLESVQNDVVAAGAELWLHDPSWIVQRVIDVGGVARFDICEPRTHPEPAAR